MRGERVRGSAVFGMLLGIILLSCSGVHSPPDTSTDSCKDLTPEAATLFPACKPWTRWDPSQIRAQLAANQSKWQKATITDYRFTLEMRSTWTHGYASIEIEGGRVKSIQPIDGHRVGLIGVVLSDSPDVGSHSIDALFETLESALRDGAQRIVVTYDPDLGFPSEIRIDNWVSAFDDEVSYTVSDFEVLK